MRACRLDVENKKQMIFHVVFETRRKIVMYMHIGELIHAIVQKSAVTQYSASARKRAN